MGEGRFGRYWQKFSGVADRFAWLVLGASVVAYALLLVGIWPWQVMVFLAILLMVGFVKLVSDLGKSQEELHKKQRLGDAAVQRLDARVGSIDGRLTAFVESQATRLLSSDECFKDLTRELKSLNDVKEVTVCLLALGLGKGMNYLQAAIDQPPVDARLRFKILVLSADYLETDPRPPRRLDHWCEHSNAAVGAVVDRMRRLAVQRPNLSLEIRRYSAWPFIHGIAVVEPVQVVYCSLCRWTHGQYDSSLATYRKIKHAPPYSERADDAQVFLSFFEHLWTSSETTRLVLDGGP